MPRALASSMAKELQRRARTRRDARRERPSFNANEMTPAQRKMAGLRPKASSSKVDVWKELTDSERANILKRDKMHLDRCRRMGIPDDLNYGPWRVLNEGIRFENNTSPNTLGGE